MNKVLNNNLTNEDNHSDYYNLRKEQESEFEESLRLDQEKEKNKIVNESEEDLEPELQ